MVSQFCETIFVYFAPQVKGPRTYKIITIGLTFLLMLLAVNNYSAYYASGDIEEAKYGIIESLESEKERNEANKPIADAIDMYLADIEASLTETRFRQHSLFRIIGCLVAFIGILFLRRRRTVGFHFFLAGMIFCLFTGFFTLGIGIIGWAFNALYFVIFMVFGLYFYFKRADLD